MPLTLTSILFGLIGGIVAALIASIKYEASYWELCLVGILISASTLIGLKSFFDFIQY